ncbi:MAG: PH domain-containing protein, partial [Mycobacterium sp.]
ADGLVYRGWFRTRTLRRADIELIRINEFRRLSRKVRLLEIDTTGPDAETALIVLSRWDLGGNPLVVLDELTEAGYARR